MLLIRTDDLAAGVDALAERYGGRVGLAAVLGDLDRRLRRTVAPCRSRHRAWTWDAVDRRDPAWWPQGVSPGPEPRILGVTWYATGGGSRLSVLDLEARRYRHVTLVRPTAEGYAPLRVHAGGLAWSGTTLHVAATKAGLWVADTGDVLRTEAGYVLPVRHRLAVTGATGEPLRFSFVSTVPDRPGELVVGEYGDRRQTRRLVHLATDGGPIEVVDAPGGGVLRAQGVVRTGDSYVFTASHGPWTPGSLWTGRPGAYRERRWAVPMGPEDLAASADGRHLWTVTEHPRRRWILALRNPLCPGG
ncbi:MULTISPECIES: hypothetical protein [unclassified Nocardioides]|uniref:hypothetical protein n=1 Tax=unclassified Nocardioides TaxID=2615069 RepID=UPI001123AF90|nr:MULTISPECIES: hypothetical protein [unclassified Nocardioides]